MVLLLGSRLLIPNPTLVNLVLIRFAILVATLVLLEQQLLTATIGMVPWHLF